MTWNITPIQTDFSKKGNANRQKYRGGQGGSFSEALGAARQRQQEGSSGDVQDFYQKHKEQETRNLWRHVEAVNKQVATLLAAQGAQTK